jgi:hypothetical protein
MINDVRDGESITEPVPFRINHRRPPSSAMVKLGD